ncbi:MAG: four helix bundle protein [Cyanobacteria bacterium]|nr:four helix bundle protein [Cyanobacteriota bacterium]
MLLCSDMDKEELQERSLQFAIDVRPICEIVATLSGGRTAGEQLLACSSSAAANYRAACRARSRAEFISKLGTVVEESDESVYWLEYIARSGLRTPNEVESHLDEARQLRAIFAASYGTARFNYNRKPRSRRRLDGNAPKQKKSRNP